MFVVPLFSLLIALFPFFTTSQFSLSVDPADQPVFLGQKVILTCQVRGIRAPYDYAVLFKRKENGISEKCQVYQKTKYQLECDPDDWRRATIYKLQIHSVSWADRGEWFCIFAANSTKQNLVVYAPAELKRMGVTSFQSQSDSSRQISRDSSADTLTGTAAGISLDEQTSTGSAPSQHMGLGTRTNPYDLRQGLGLQLTCETSCGFPEANISWLITNQTTTRSDLPTAGPNRIQSDQCNRNPNTRDMSTTRSALNVDCMQLRLVGLNQVQCTVTGRQYQEDQTPMRHVYVLCPGGERPLQLTKGEFIAISAGAAIGLILVLVGCVVLRGSRKDSPFPINGHFLGQRV